MSIEDEVCWNSRPWKFISPRDANLNISNYPVIARQGEIVNYDRPHTISLPFERFSKHPLLLYVGGTGCTPLDNPTLWLLETGLNIGYPVISLSYQWVPLADMEKNAHMCDHPNAQSELLKYHNDVVFGGKGLLTDVSVDRSIDSMLLSLLLHLLKSDTYSPEDRLIWGNYLLIEDEKYMINYNNIVIAGHSQGAGHVAFYAKFRKFRRAILFSGPQDYLDFRGSWLDGEFLTSDIRSFRHEREEGTAALIQQNLQHIRPLLDQRPLTVSIDDVGDIQFVLAKYSDEEFRVLSSNGCDTNHITDETITNEAFNCADFRIFISRIDPRCPEFSTRPCHNSTVLDKLTPRLSSGHSVYSMTVWRYLLNIEDE